MEELARKILTAAHETQVSDVYLLPDGEDFRLYFRDANVRRLVQKVDGAQAHALIAHFKFVAGMNVGEKRRSQLGACVYQLTDARSQRLRLSTVGDFSGRESLVIRLLHASDEPLDFWFDGLSDAEKLISGRGLYLFSGPVGSGKTSLMMALARAKFAQKQVITIEDPVEIIDSHFLQLQRNDLIGATYEDLITLSLRHRPDLVIVGEIRDELTARSVIRASLTGYTVFSTVHAKSISGVYARLRELGVTAGELENSLSGVIYQRLISGRGLIDAADGNYKEYTHGNWNKKLDTLVAKGFISHALSAQEKIIA
ncbi:MAG: Flp pilus assembly complex ATPase component TadA [Streptococcaceae bacterium]|jgi:competence protein ComGA|nr:Flp pilus assembly complex ATPase component TadA [Streptococcaceae bacterium]